MIPCSAMRNTTLTATLLLLTGAGALTLAETLGPAAPLAYAGLLMVLAAAVALAVALGIAILPGNARRLGGCQH